MGQSHGQGLQGVTQRVESRIGKISITGRYHRLPKRLEDDYKVENLVLGSGYNGAVHLAQSIHHHNATFAVKNFKLNGVHGDKRRELEREAEIFLGMDHPHVARLVDVYESENSLSLVMECLTGGELLKRVQEQKRYSEREAADAVLQMLLAINYIHSHGVVHRDIKLENFLYDSAQSEHLKLIDFGFSKIWVPNRKMALSCGTLPYVAPEVLEHSYTNQCDMWSLGVSAFVILFGYMPFSGKEHEQVMAIKAGMYNVKHAIWDRVSRPAKDFVKKLLVVDPGRRLTAAQALEQPWIAKRSELLQEHSAMSKEIAEALISFGQASAFRRAAMLMMAWSLTNEERAKVRQAFMELDTDRKGTITAGEFKHVIEDTYHINDEVAMQAFEALDVTHNEEIHYSEFLAAMVSSRIAIHDDLLWTTFHRFDTHNSGFISADDLREVLGESFEGEEVEQLLEEVDTSHDGKISYEEFIAYLKSGHANSDHQHIAAKVIDHQLSKTLGDPKRSSSFGKGLQKLIRKTTAIFHHSGQDASEPQRCRCRCAPRCSIL